MSTNETVLREIQTELQDLNQNIKLLLKHQQESAIVLKQIADYLRDYQSIVDFALKDNTKNHEILLREIKSNFTKLSVLINPNLIGASRSMNNRIISSEDDAINTISKSYLELKAERSLDPANPNDAAYYRVGYLFNMSQGAYQTVDEGFPAQISSPQNLRIVSTSANDSFTGSGVRQVLVGGVDETLTRSFEIVTLAGTSPVYTAMQFFKFDILNSVAVGGLGNADGEIIVTDIDNSVAYGHIAPGQNVWRSGRLYTDNHITAYVDFWSIGSFNASVRTELQGGHLPGYLGVDTRCLCTLSNDTKNFSFPVPIKIPKQSLVNVRGIAKGPNSEVGTSIILHVHLEP